jgi:hypothetical protein
MKHTILVGACSLLLACGTPKVQTMGTTFQDDVTFLQKHTPVVLLSTKNNQSIVAITPALQGRIMTSTCGGSQGPSFGWINRELLTSGQNNLHINAFGGEDRFWLGPEGGQYALFFKKGDPFDLDHWYTPPPINEGAYDIVSQDENSVVFKKPMTIRNYADFTFNLELERTVRLLHRPELVQSLGMELPHAVDLVAFESVNKITNTGSMPWTKDSGLVSIWILGMFNPSPNTVVAVPYVPGPESEKGVVLVSNYFGDIPADRLQVKSNAIFFKGDGLYRSKIGVPRPRVKPIMGSYDSKMGVLTLVQFTLPEEATDYVNSLWKITEQPYGGDVANSYNDGPASPGAKPMGPFYEMESSSPAAALFPGASMSHNHRTIHLHSDEATLDRIAGQLLGVSIQDFKTAFSDK